MYGLLVFESTCAILGLPLVIVFCALKVAWDKWCLKCWAKNEGYEDKLKDEHWCNAMLNRKPWTKV